MKLRIKITKDHNHTWYSLQKRELLFFWNDLVRTTDKDLLNFPGRNGMDVSVVTYDFVRRYKV